MTAYIKMVDIWMIFMMIFPFFVVSLFTIMEVMKHNNEKMKVKKVSKGWIDEDVQNYEKSMRLVSFLLDCGLVVVMAIFIIIFWAFGLNNYSSTYVDSVC